MIEQFPYIPESWPGTPSGHRGRALLERKMSLIVAPHVKDLNDWVRMVNYARGGEAAGESLVPWFDPSGGGTRARILFLLEAPGRKSSTTRGSGFILSDNDDSTAANLFTLVTEAGLRRGSFAMANIVPRYLPDGSRTDKTRHQDVLDASVYINAMLDVFDQLDLVTTMGQHTSRGWEVLCSTSERARSIDRKKVPHPGAQNLNTRPSYRDDIRNALIAAYSFGS